MREGRQLNESLVRLWGDIIWNLHRINRFTLHPFYSALCRSKNNRRHGLKNQLKKMIKIKTILIMFVFVLLMGVGKVNAQWTVIDPSNIAQSIVNDYKSLVKEVDIVFGIE